MSAGLQDAYRLLAAESAIWAMEPRALEALAVTLARGDKMAARIPRSRGPLKTSNPIPTVSVTTARTVRPRLARRLR